jgi:hypothetical protein
MKKRAQNAGVHRKVRVIVMDGVCEKKSRQARSLSASASFLAEAEKSCLASLKP